MSQRLDVRFIPRHCPFLHKEVWAILTRHKGGRWQIVNCLDKNKGCYQQYCALTTMGGDWPFDTVWVQDRELRHAIRPRSRHSNAV